MPVVTPALRATEAGEVEPIMPHDPRAAKVGEVESVATPNPHATEADKVEPFLLVAHELRTAPTGGPGALEANATSPARPSLTTS